MECLIPGLLVSYHQQWNPQLSSTANASLSVCIVCKLLPLLLLGPYRIVRFRISTIGQIKAVKMDREYVEPPDVCSYPNLMSKVFSDMQ